jgi:hypothetical protein
MFLTHVESSNLTAVGYNPFAGVLTIVFRGDRAYQYFGVPPGVHLALLRAESHGRFFHRHVRNQYRYRRIR